MPSKDNIQGRLDVLNELWDYINSPVALSDSPNLANKHRTEQSWLICQIAVKRQGAADALKEPHA